MLRPNPVEGKLIHEYSIGGHIILEPLHDFELKEPCLGTISVRWSLRSGRITS
jgi:hypothetical protein